MLGPEALGTNHNNKVLIYDNLMDSKPYFLTGNTSTLYVLPTFNLKETGATVVEVPPGMLGAFNDAWFRYMQDVGPMGPDKGAGGKFLLLPPDYEGDIPAGYFVVKISHLPSLDIYAWLHRDPYATAIKNATD